jgi:hypothetical protein
VTKAHEAIIHRKPYVATPLIVESDF